MKKKTGFFAAAVAATFVLASCGLEASKPQTGTTTSKTSETTKPQKPSTSVGGQTTTGGKTTTTGTTTTGTTTTTSTTTGEPAPLYVVGDLRDYSGQTDPVSLFGKDITVAYDDEVKAAAIKTATDVLDAAKAGVAEWSTVDKLYNEVFTNTYYNLIDQYRYAGIIADTTGAEEDYAVQDAVLELINELEAYDQEIDIAMAASVYRNQYYKDKTDDEIDAYVAGLDPEATRAENEKSATMNSALTMYYGDKTKWFEALTTYLGAAKELATMKGYDDYLTYAYSNIYSREYSVDDSNQLATFIKEYIVPTQNEALTTFITARDACRADVKAEKYDTDAVVSYYTFLDLYDSFFGANLDYLTSYAQAVGGSYGANWNKFFEEKNYFFSANANDNVTGYVSSFSDGTPFMFLGADYQGLPTFIHEYGHYNARLNGTGGASYDLKETQSQGNEMLFYNYLYQTDLDKGALDTFNAYQVYSMTGAVIQGYLINEMEKYTYGTNVADMTEESVRAAWTKVCTDAGLEDYINYFDSWTILVLLNYQGYYISYATSAVAALEIGAAAKTDWTEAKNVYLKIAANQPAGSTFTSSIVDAGLKSVFDEDAYKAIYAAYVGEKTPEDTTEATE